MSEESPKTSQENSCKSNIEKDKPRGREKSNDLEKQRGWRRGKWTVEEEEYSSKLIEEFRNGLLHLEGGKTLRTYLSEKLNCDPMRISKKYTGCNSIGKQSFKRTTEKATVMNRGDKERILSEIEFLRKRFLDRISCNSKVDKKIRNATCPTRSVSKNKKPCLQQNQTSKVSNSESFQPVHRNVSKCNHQCTEMLDRYHSMKSIEASQRSTQIYQDNPSESVNKISGSYDHELIHGKQSDNQYPINVTPVDIVPPLVPAIYEGQLSLDPVHSYTYFNEHPLISNDPVASDEQLKMYYGTPNLQLQDTDEFQKSRDQFSHWKNLSDRVDQENLINSLCFEKNYVSSAFDQESFANKQLRGKYADQVNVKPSTVDEGSRKTSTIRQRNSVQDFINLIGDTDTKFLEQNFALVIGSDNFPTSLPISNEMNYVNQVFPTDDLLQSSNCRVPTSDISNFVYPPSYSYSLENITNSFPNELSSSLEYSSDIIGCSNTSNLSLKRVFDEADQIGNIQSTDRKKVKLETSCDF